MTVGEDRLERLRALALADCAVLVAGVASEPLTAREKRVIVHVVDLMDAVCTTVHTENVRLVARLAECLDDPPDEMAVAI